MKEEVKTDAQLQAMQHHFQIIQPQLFCDSNNSICRVCVNPKCQKPSLICNDLQCNICGNDAHLKCFNSPLKGITTILNQRTTVQKDFLSSLLHIQNEFIDAIYQSRKALIKKYYLGDLQEKYLKIVEQEVYQLKNAKYLKGKEARQFCQRLLKQNDKAAQRGQILLQSYSKLIKNFFQEMINLKQKLYQSCVKGQEVFHGKDAQIDSIILKNLPIIPLREMNTYDALIAKHFKFLSHQLIKQQVEFIKKSLKYPTKFQLLYRGSQNQFSVAKFHQKCDNIPDTLTIMRTEFGKTIAGYSKYTWNASNGYVNDIGKHAFMLSLDLKERFVPKDGTNLISCDSNYGPRFGVGSADLFICGKCNINTNSYANFPNQYNREGESKLLNKQQSYKALTGLNLTTSKQFSTRYFELCFDMLHLLRLLIVRTLMDFYDMTINFRGCMMIFLL